MLFGGWILKTALLVPSTKSKHIIYHETNDAIPTCHLGFVLNLLRI